MINPAHGITKLSVHKSKNSLAQKHPLSFKLYRISLSKCAVLHKTSSSFSIILLVFFVIFLILSFRPWFSFLGSFMSHSHTSQHRAELLHWGRYSVLKFVKTWEDVRFSRSYFVSLSPLFCITHLPSAPHHPYEPYAFLHLVHRVLLDLNLYHWLNQPWQLINLPKARMLAVYTPNFRQWP